MALSFIKQLQDRLNEHPEELTDIIPHLNKLIDTISKEIKRGKLEGDVKDITLRMFREFYQFMWTNRSYWEPRLKSA